MKKVLLSGIGLLAAIAFVEPALADGFEKPQRATAPARAARPAQPAQQPQQQSANWNGSQAGGSNGASSVNNNFVEPGAYNFFSCGGGCYETPFQYSSNKTGYIIGGFYGYRQQFGNYVVGVEGDINWQNGSSSKSQNTPPTWLLYEQFTGSQKQGVDGSLRLRAGFLVTPFTLVYATGGLAIGQVSGSFSYYGADATGAVYGAANWSDTRVGGTIGAGVETALSAGVKARAEYRYTNLGKYSKDVPLANTYVACPPGSCGTTAHIDLKATNQRFLVGLGFDLGR